MSDCIRCQTRGKTWDGDDPKCGFKSGIFDTENWNCATLNELRELARDEKQHSKIVYSYDHNAALIPFGPEYISLLWYKSRGRCEQALLLNSSGATELTLQYAEAVLDGVDPDDFNPST